MNPKGSPGACGSSGKAWKWQGRAWPPAKQCDPPEGHMEWVEDILGSVAKDRGIGTPKNSYITQNYNVHIH